MLISIIYFYLIIGCISILWLIWEDYIESNTVSVFALPFAIIIWPYIVSKKLFK
jgi:hypothetical protein